MIGQTQAQITEIFEGLRLRVVCRMDAPVLQRLNRPPAHRQLMFLRPLTLLRGCAASPAYGRVVLAIRVAAGVASNSSGSDLVNGSSHSYILTGLWDVEFFWHCGTTPT